MKTRTMAICTVLCFTAFSLMGQNKATAFKIVYQSLAWSSDGANIYFTAIKVKPDWSDFAPGKWGLFLYELGTENLKKLDSGALYLSLSADGMYLAYDRTTGGNRDIYVMELKNHSIKKLTTHAGKDGGPSWSNDDHSIAFHSNRGEDEEVWVIDVDTRETRQVTDWPEAKSYNLVWSPISSLIAYYKDKSHGKDQIFVTDPLGSFQKNLTDDDHHNIYPSWTPDGKVIYTRDHGEVMMMNADGSDKIRLMDKPAGQVIMSPDGKQLLFTFQESLFTYDIGKKKKLLLLEGRNIYRD